MMIFDITCAGAFMNAIDTAAKSDARNRVRDQAVEKAPEIDMGHIFVGEKSSFYDISDDLPWFEGSSNGLLAGDSEKG